MTLDDFKQLVIFKCLDAPSWVKWIAVDKDGDVFVSSHELRTNNTSICRGLWIVYDFGITDDEFIDHRVVNTITIPPEIDWKDTLIKLP